MKFELTTSILSKWHQPSGPYTRRRDGPYWTTAKTGRMIRIEFFDSVSMQRETDPRNAKDVLRFTRERTPKDLLQAAALVEEFFANKERDFSSWDSSRGDKSNGGDKATPRDKQQDRTKPWRRMEKSPSPNKPSHG